MNTIRPSFLTLPALALLGSAALSAAAAKGPRLNGFDLSYSLIPASEILRGGPPKDGIPALTHPPIVSADRAGFLTDRDLVVGVVLRGQSRAYPLRVLVWHENVNDTVGGYAIAVTYCPLCNSAFVFNRKIGGETREFGVSGLLWNSNVLLYDRRDDPARESLWSQVWMRAVTGPAARQGLKLPLLPSQMTTWKAWRDEHPDTTVLSSNTGYPRNYAVNPYRRYFATDRLMFPVSAYDTMLAHGYSRKSMVAILDTGTELKAYVFDDVKKAQGDRDFIEDRIGSRVFRVEYRSDSNTLRIREITEQGERPARVAYTYWFALAAMYPRIELFVPEP